MKLLYIMCFAALIGSCSTINNRNIASELETIYDDGYIKFTVINYDIGKAIDSDYTGFGSILGGTGAPEFSIMFDEILDDSNIIDYRLSRLAYSVHYLWYKKINKDSRSFKIKMSKLKKMMASALRSGKDLRNGSFVLKLAETDWTLREIPVPTTEFVTDKVESEERINIGNLINGDVTPINFKDPVNGLHIQMTAEFINDQEN